MKNSRLQIIFRYNFEEMAPLSPSPSTMVEKTELSPESLCVVCVFFLEACKNFLRVRSIRMFHNGVPQYRFPLMFYTNTC